MDEAKTTAKKTKEEKTPAFDLEALKAELLAELRKEQEAAAANSAAEKTEEEKNAEAYLNEIVKVHLFKDGKDYKDDLIVHLNGKNFAIQRGVDVEIPRKFALLIEQHERQDVIAAEYAEARQNEYRDQAKRYNV